MKNKTVDLRNPALIREIGLSALQKELGSVGAIYFIRQFSIGRGDYTAERDKMFEGITLDEMVDEIREIERKQEDK